MIKAYYQLTKPGIVFGNAITGTAGFFLASRTQFEWIPFVGMLVGLSFIVAAGCVLNNYFDRIADQRMERTKMRPLAKGVIPLRHAILFGFSLLILGSLILTFLTTVLAAFIALLGFGIYVGFYTIWKYKTVYATEIGSLAGAVPPVVGYTAVSAHMDLGAFLIFSVVALWQMPHFFAIAIYRQKEYASALIPVLPLKKGVNETKKQMIFYMALYFFAAASLTIFGFTGYFYLLAAMSLGIYWVFKTINGIQSESEHRWARGVFSSSLLVIMGLCLAIVIDFLCR